MNSRHLLSAMGRTSGWSDEARLKELLASMVARVGCEQGEGYERLGEYVWQAHQELQALPERKVAGSSRALVELLEDGTDGEVHELGDESEIVIGREGDWAFDDEFLSPRHAMIEQRDEKVFVRDLDSINGSFVRVIDTLELKHDDVFLAGRQVLRFIVEKEPTQVSNGTRLMGSPSPEKPLARLAQIGPQGEVFRMEQVGELGMHIGRTAQNEPDGFSAMAFEDDRFMSEHHVRIVRRKGRWVLDDQDSSNGTWIRLDAERELKEGDFLFVGTLLFRVMLGQEDAP